MPHRTARRRRWSEGGPGFIAALGSTRLGVFVIGRIVSPLQRRLYRWSDGRLAFTRGAPVLLLTTIGRKSGEPRTVPVFYLRDGDRIVVCNVTPPFERTNPWTLNLDANPVACVQIGPERHRCRSRPATDEEVAHYWPRLTAMWPTYQRFLDRGGKRSVFVLEPERIG